MTRTRAITAIAIPLAIALTIHDAVQAQQRGQPPATAQSAASSSGVDLDAMDRAANPCTDFYQYACGGWTAKHPAPPDQPRYGRFDELQNRNNEILRAILQDAMASGVTDPDVKKIGDYYASCMSEDVIEAKGTAPLDADLKRVAAIKSKSEIPPVVGHFQTVGTTSFFGFGAAPDFKDASQYILIYAQGGMGLPDRDYYLKDDANAVKVRGEYQQHVAKMLEFSGETPAAAAAAAKAVLKIETGLAKASLDRVAQRNPTNIYHKMPRDEVKKLMPNFNLSSFMEIAEAPPGDTANVTEPEFLKAVDQEIASTDLNDLKSYMRWHVINANAPMLPKKFADENFNFYGRTLTGAAEDKPRWKRCVDATDSDLGEALGKIYVQRTFGPEGKARTV
ncbi:MAG TPA: M13 family metallopeptidase N-terminal domain-containing protein, partial [Vicinamibacterales bacterium]